MKRILTSYFILISIFAFSQSLTTINKASKNQEKKTISSNREVINKTKLIDTTTLNFENKEITIPSNRQNTTKIVIVKEKEKTDWLKYSLPVFTLLLGIWIKEILEKHSNKTKIKKSGERWIAELRSLKEPLEQQIKSLQKFQTENDTNEFEIPNLGLYSSVSGDIFKSLDKSELIKFIEQNNKDLDFKKHSISESGIERYQDAKQAKETFENNYGVSVIFGNCFYSNGKDTYEVAVLYDGNITYNTEITDDVLGYLSEEEVSEIMIKVQSL